MRCHFQLSLLPITAKHGLYAKSKGVYNYKRSPFKGVFENEEAEKKHFDRQKYLLQLQEEIEQITNQLKINKCATEQANIDEFKYQTLRGIFEVFLYDNTDKKIFGNKAYTDLLLYHLHSSDLGRKVSRKLHHISGWLDERYFKKAEDDGPLFSEAALEKMATDWALVIGYILDWQARKPKQMLLVNYEKLRTQTQQEVSRILAFLDADNSDEIVSQVVDKNSFSKLKSGSNNSFFRKGTSGDWKNHFTEQDIQLFKRIAGDLMERCGYEE